VTGHRVEHDLEGDRRSRALLGEQADSGDHVAADVVACDREARGIDVELVRMGSVVAATSEVASSLVKVAMASIGDM
jgi:hypothetical protein